MKRLKQLAALLVVIAGLLAVAPSAGAAELREEALARHCVVEIGDKNLPQESAETCFESEAAVDSYLGDKLQRASSNVIGRHYSGTRYSGSSITVVGTTCGGGVWYATGFWNNNIESTRNYCGSVGTRFYDSSSCSGSSRLATSDQLTLGWMNNRTSCVRYG